MYLVISNNIAYSEIITKSARVLRVVTNSLLLSGWATTMYCTKLNAKTMKKDKLVRIAATAPAISQIFFPKFLFGVTSVPKEITGTNHWLGDKSRDEVYDRQSDEKASGWTMERLKRILIYC